MAGYSVTFTVVDQATRQIDQINRRIQQLRAPMERQARVMSRFVDVTGLRNVASGFGTMAQQAGQAFSSVSRLVPAMGAITGAATIAGVFKLAQSWSDLGTKLQDIASRTGSTAERINHLQNVARVAGGNVDTMTEALGNLSNKLYDAQLAKDPTAVAAFRRLGVAIRDANGNFRNAEQVLPELLTALDGIKDPADRMRLAVATGGDSLFRLTNEIERAQRPGETLTETWRRLNEQASKYDTAIDEGKLQRYREATGKLDAAFNGLKITVGSTLATALTPLIGKFEEWVSTHQPEINRATERVLGGFTNLIGVLAGGEGEGGGGIGGVVGAAALVVAALGPIKFAAGIISSVSSITSAIGTLGAIAGGGLLTGVGLLGALGIALWLGYEIYKNWGDIKQAGSDLAASAVAGWERIKQNIQDTDAMAKGFRGEAANPTPLPTGPPGPPRPTGGPTPFGGGVGYGKPVQQDFLAKAWPLAQREAARTGLDPRLIIGQAALESNWGTSRRATQQGNFFGIKGAGPGGRDFATHGSMDESFRAYGDLMLSERYRTVREAQGLEAQVEALGASPYTPDIGYSGQIGAIARGLGAAGGDGQAGLQGNLAQRTGALGTPEQAGQNLVTVQTASGAKFRVHRAGAEQFKGFLNELEGTGYFINPQEAGSYNVRRNVNSPSQWSSHSYGSAIDINPSLNPNQPAGGNITNLPANIGDIAARYGLRYGGAPGFGAFDPQHFELASLGLPQGQPAEVTGGTPVSGAVDVAITHRNPPPGTTITASGTGDVNVPPPRTEQQQFAFA